MRDVIILLLDNPSDIGECLSDRHNRIGGPVEGCTDDYNLRVPIRDSIRPCGTSLSLDLRGHLNKTYRL